MYRNHGMVSSPSPRTGRREKARVNSPDVHGHSGLSSSPTKLGPQVQLGLRPSSSASSILAPSRRRRSSSGQSSRSNSPLTLSTENVHSIGAAYSIGHSHLSDSGTSPSARSPYQSPAHSRSSSVNSMKNIARDRAYSEQMERENFMYHGNSGRDRSLDRFTDRQDHRDFDGTYYTYGGRERVGDREYPHMGARSLERDQMAQGNLVRSRSTDQEFGGNHLYIPVSDPNQSKESLIFDLQSHIANLNKECLRMQQELNSAKEKLNSSMNSIKTFWSPELKKERALRKEESAKMNSLAEEMRDIQKINQKLKTKVKDLEIKTRQGSPSHSISTPNLLNDTTNGDLSADTTSQLSTLKKEKDRQVRESKLLRKTVEEMELRIETQKQTLSARDESIKKLLEMLQSKGLTVKQMEEDRTELEQMREKVVETTRLFKQQQISLQQKETESAQLNQELDRVKSELTVTKNKRDSASSEILHAMLDNKDSRIQSLEKEISLLEEDLMQQKRRSADYSEKLAHGPTEEEVKLLQTKNQELKDIISGLKQELSSIEKDLVSLQSEVDIQKKQTADKDHHIDLLKEKLNAKEREMKMMSVDLGHANEKANDSKMQLEHKTRSLSAVQSEKQSLESTVQELRDTRDIQDRKVGVLQRKVTNLEEMLEEKNSQVNQLRSNMNAMSANQSGTDTALQDAQKHLRDKEKSVERLKDEREKVEQEHQEELQRHIRVERDLQSKLEQLHSQMDNKQHELMSLREEITKTRNEKNESERRLSGLEMEIGHKSEDLVQLENKIKQMEHKLQDNTSKLSQEKEREKEAILTQVKSKEEEVTKMQSEVDRLLGILQQTENEKFEKDKQIKEQEESLKEYQKKVGTLKRTQQSDKTKNAQLLEEARKREENVGQEGSQLKTIIKQREERIEELEEALRESVKITAEREMLLADHQEQLMAAEQHFKEMCDETDVLHTDKSDLEKQMKDIKEDLETKDRKLKQLQKERTKHLTDAYEMQQEAILAAITEKDAHIALLEMTPNNAQNIEQVGKLTNEKIKLQTQLKDLTQTRMKLLQSEDPSNDSVLVKKLKEAPPEKNANTNDGIWA